MTTVSFDPITATPEALDLFLAEQKSLCPCGPDDGWTCNHEDGELPRFPEFQEKCPCPRYCVAYEYSDEGDWQLCGPCSTNWDRESNVMGAHGDWCENCQGRNWKPDITEAKLWPYIQLVNRYGPKFLADTMRGVDGRIYFGWRIYNGAGATALEAMKRALAARVVAEQASP